MPEVRDTSRTFDGARRIYAALQTAPWTAHPVTSEEPSIQFADEQEHERETVALVALVDEDTGIAWRRMSPSGRDELIVYQIVIRTEVPGVEDSVAVLDRLEALADIAQRVFYDPDTHEFVLFADVDWFVQAAGVGGVSWQILAGTEGYVGAALIQVNVQARI